MPLSSRIKQPLWEEAHTKQRQRLPYQPPEVTARPQGRRPKPTVGTEEISWAERAIYVRRPYCHAQQAGGFGVPGRGDEH